MKKYITYLFSCIMISISACGQEKKVNQEFEVPSNWQSLNETNFTIQYPDTFELNKSGQMGIRFILFSKLTSQQDFFRENVNLLTQDLAGHNLDLNKFVEISENQIKTLIIDGNLIESKRFSENSDEYHRIIYTGKQGEKDFKWLQYYWVKNEKAYILTLTCEANQYDSYISVGEAIMKTFRLK